MCSETFTDKKHKVKKITIAAVIQNISSIFRDRKKIKQLLKFNYDV